MRKPLYGVGIFLFAAALSAGFYGSYRLGAEKKQTTTDKDSLPASLSVYPIEQELLPTDSRQTASYLLEEENGRVVVYSGENAELFEYTDILVEELPAEVQKELPNGIRISDVRELYSFLENYSS